jgi:hypothetical protein
MFASTLRAAWLVSTSVILASGAFAFNFEAQRVCGSDALRLCSSEVPDVERITLCMRKQRAKLSNECRSMVERDEARRAGGWRHGTSSKR